MRQTQRMQIGLAMLAVLFCFSTPWVLQRMQTAAHAENYAATLAQVRHVNLLRDATLRVYVRSSQPRAPLAEVRARDHTVYQELARDIARARLVHPVMVANRPQCTVVFSTAAGRPDAVFWADAAGRLTDPYSHKIFQAGPVWTRFLSTLPYPTVHPAP